MPRGAAPGRPTLSSAEASRGARRAACRFFERWDLLLCPPAASAAFVHDHEGERWERTVPVNERDVPTTDQLFWAGFPGVAYLPGTVAPIGFTPSGLPVGVQIVGPQYADRACIDFGRLLEREYHAFVPPPGYD